MKRKNGYIILKDYQVISEKSEWSLGSIYEWIRMDGKEYMYKAEKEEDALRELFWSFVLERIKVDHISYDLAIYDGTTGVISKNYNENNNIILLYEIIEEYQKQSSYHSFNIQQLKQIFTWYFQHQNRTNLIAGSTLQFIIQILCGNTDLHSRNFTIKNETIPAVGPLFDYGDYGKIDWNGKNNTFILKANPIATNNPTLIFKNFLCSAKPNEMKLFYHYLQQMKKINANHLLEQIEESIKRILEEDIKKTLTRSLTKNLEQVEKCLD